MFEFFMIACSIRKLLTQVCVSFQREQTIAILHQKMVHKYIYKQHSFMYIYIHVFTCMYMYVCTYV